MNLAPYQIQRYFDGTEVMWLITKNGQPNGEAHDTKEDAVTERNRLNSNYALSSVGV